MNLQCPRCQSDKVARLEMVYGSGFSRTMNIGVGNGSNNQDFMGVSQTHLSKKAGPPRKKIWYFWILLPMFTLVLAAIPKIGTVVWLAMWGVAIWRIVIGRRYNKHIWPHLYQRWQQKWMCEKCGEIFEPESVTVVQ